LDAVRAETSTCRAWQLKSLKEGNQVRNQKNLFFLAKYFLIYFSSTPQRKIVYSALLNGSCPRDSGIYKIPLKIEAAGGIQVEVAPGEVCGIHSYVHRYRGRRNNSSTGNLFTFVFMIYL